MYLSGRHESVDPDGYRYGFQGQELDHEVKGEGNSYNYTFRMHDPRLGSFFAVDPLSYNYPYWGPYSFSGNQLISAHELEGSEPNNNPKTPGTSEKLAMTTIANIVYNAVQNTNQINGPLTPSKAVLKGEYLGTGIKSYLNEKAHNGVNYVTDTDETPADKFNMYVSNQNSFLVDESNSGNFRNYEAYVVGAILYNFMNGSGPENYVFPTNGVISSKFKDSDILKKALNDYQKKGTSNKAVQYSFGLSTLASDALSTETFFSITGMVGSGTITITDKGDDLLIEIFNITSLTSGALGKEFFSESKYPKSYVRDNDKKTQFGNKSQTFSFTIKKKDLPKQKKGKSTQQQIIDSGSDPR